MKIKKIILPLAGAVAGVSLVALTSCGSKSTNTITFYTTSGDTLMTVLESAAEEFHKANPDYTVEITNGYSYDTLKTKIQSDLGAGAQPCLAVAYGDHVATYLTSGKVLNFNDYIDDATNGLTADEKADLATYWSEGTVFEQEGRYTIPFNKSTDVLYYNKTVVGPYLEKYGIDPENPTSDFSKWTWENLWKVCEDLKKDYPKSTPLGYDSDSSWVISYLESYSAMNNGTKYYTDSTQSGENKILFDNDVTKDFFNSLVDKYKAGLVTTKGVTGSYTSGLFTKYTSSVDKKTYDGSFISIGSSGGASHQMPSDDAFEVSIAGTPSYDGTGNSVKMISQGPSFVMFDQGNDDLELATWKFVKYLLSEDVQAAYALASGGYAPASSKALAKVLASPECTEVNKACLSAMQSMNQYFYTSDCFNGSATARTQIGDALTSTLKDKGNASSYIKEAAKEAKYYTK